MTKKDFVNNLHSMLKHGTDVRRCYCPECLEKNRRSPHRCSIKHILSRFSCGCSRDVCHIEFVVYCTRSRDYGTLPKYVVTCWTHKPQEPALSKMEFAEFSDGSMARIWKDRLNARIPA